MSASEQCTHPLCLSTHGCSGTCAGAALQPPQDDPLLRAETCPAACLKALALAALSASLVIGLSLLGVRWIWSHLS